MKKRSFTNITINDGTKHSINISENGLYIDDKLSAKSPSLIIPINSFDFADNLTLIIGKQDNEMPSFDVSEFF